MLPSAFSISQLSMTSVTPPKPSPRLEGWEGGVWEGQDIRRRTFAVWRLKSGWKGRGNVDEGSVEGCDEGWREGWGLRGGACSVPVLWV